MLRSILIKSAFAFLFVLSVLFPLVAKADKQWEYTGTTPQGLVDLMTANGAGTYIITNTIDLSSTLTITQPGVTLITRYVAEAESPPTFRMLTNSAGVVVTGNSVRFKDCFFSASDEATYSGNLITWRGAKGSAVDCTFFYGKGTGIRVEGAWSLIISNPFIKAKYQDYTGIGIVLTNNCSAISIIGSGYGRGIYYGFAGIWAEVASGVYIEKLMTSGSRYGLFLYPTYNLALYDFVLSDVNFDGAHDYGSCVRLYDDGRHAGVQSFFFNNCWMTTQDNGGPAYQFDSTVTNISITGGMASSQYGSDPILFLTPPVNKTISGVLIIDR